ncbi:hypothetical protein M3B92_12645 [Brevibacterium casei]|uniref:hypothetical protein n=1 Tax=Brevibacterium casei TaxID=33889 RepID=UPI00223C2BBF|nr:hypothetical protein [Brevibacterium casei]MCT1766959.1 hypothetical protein [Brevibacterium casei]
MTGIARTKKYGLVCLLISVVCLAVGGIGFLVGAKAEDIWPPALLIVGGLAALLGLGALFDNGDAAGGAHTTTSSMNDITRNR